MKDQGCDVVNMDTLSIYAVTPVCAHDAHREVGCLYVGTVTDSVTDAGLFSSKNASKLSFLW